MTKNQFIAFVVVLLALLSGSMQMIAYAEDDIPGNILAEPATEEPAEPTPEPVPVTIDTEALASALAEAMATAEPTAEPDQIAEPSAVPEPTPQVIVIQSTPETAAPTMEPTIWDKPFNDYTPTEGLLLLIFVLIVLYLVYYIFGR